MIAALYVAKGGCYFGLEGVDPWDEARDARLYAGPWPVVAHPPCQRWGRYWGGGPSLHGTPKQKIKGDDGGCFAAALASEQADCMSDHYASPEYRKHLVRTEVVRALSSFNI